MIGPLFFGFQVQPYVVLFVERSGSTYLATLLDSHPHIISLRERFSELRQDGRSGAEQLAWADAFFRPPFVGRTRARGFKTKLVDIPDQDAFAELLQRRNCKIVCLQRRNRVKGVVSTLNARRLWETTGTWNLLDESKRMSTFSIRPHQFHKLLLERELWDLDIENYVNQLSLPTLWLKYEDLLCDEQTFLANVFAFLGVPPHLLRGRTYKHTKDDLRQAIENFDELRTTYAGTCYEPMFDEILAQKGG